MFERNDEDYGLVTRCFSYATDLAALFNDEPSRPRTAVRRCHRANKEPETLLLQYWLHICRFWTIGEIVCKMSGLVQSVIDERDDVPIKGDVKM